MIEKLRMRTGWILDKKWQVSIEYNHGYYLQIADMELRQKMLNGEVKKASFVLLKYDLDA